MLKILQPGFSKIVNFQMFKMDFKEAEEAEIKMLTSIGSQKMQESSRKTSTSVLLTTPKPLTVWITTVESCSREYQTTWPASWEICMHIKRQQSELDMEQQTGSKLGKEYIKATYCHPACFNLNAEYIMRNAGQDEAEAGIKIEERNINNLRYADDTTLMV